MREKFFLLLREMRAAQWTKNFLVYAAIIFNGSLFHSKNFFTTSVIFLTFCFAASGIYIINDIYDLEKDRVNPEKSHRPLAAGKLSVKFSLVCSCIFLAASVIISFAINFSCSLLVISYVILNFLYTIKLKHVVILDVMIIAYGFVVRAVAGAWAGGVKMTAWFLLCVMFLSLFLALSKRRHELITITGGREVLKYYSVAMIDQMISVVTSALIICYALFTMDSATKNNNAMAFTVPLVLYGIFYYLYVIHVKRGGGSPDEALYKEKPILITVIIYVAFVIFIRN